MHRATTLVPTGYSERHHIRPRCLDGDNTPSNIVRLTPEEHYIAHQLLVKMYPGNIKILWAAVAMTNGTTKQSRRNKLYGWLRRQLAARLSEKFKGHSVSAESRAKMSASQLGKKRAPHSEDTKAKMSAASKGRPKSAAHRTALATAKLGKQLGPRSELHRRHIAESLRQSDKLKQAIRAFASTPEYRAKQSAITTEVWARRRAEEASRH